MTLTTIERRWARAVFDTMYPRGGDPRLPIGIADLDVDGYLDDVGRAWPATAFLGLRAAIAMIALAPLLVFGRLRSIVGLSPEDRVRLLDRLYASRIYTVRALVVLVKANASMLYGAAEEVRRVVAPGARVASSSVAQLRRKARAA